MIPFIAQPEWREREREMAKSCRRRACQASFAASEKNIFQQFSTRNCCFVCPEINSEVLRLLAPPVAHDCVCCSRKHISLDKIPLMFPDEMVFHFEWERDCRRTGFHSQHDFSFIHFGIVCFLFPHRFPLKCLTLVVVKWRHGKKMRNFKLGDSLCGRNGWARSFSLISIHTGTTSKPESRNQQVWQLELHQILKCFKCVSVQNLKYKTF